VQTTTAAHDARIGVLDPATGERLGDIPAGGPAEAAAAVARARAAAPGWARTHPSERAAVLRAAAAAIRGARDELALLTTREGGRRLADSLSGVDAAAGALEQAAELGPLHGGTALAGAWGATDLAVHEPRGVVAVICPWNDPLAIAGNGLGAALATGNTVVLKPSERTPLSTVRMLEVAGLPDGVVVPALGDGRMGRALVAHPGVDAVVFTGSLAAGREIGAVCGGRLVKAVLELGGKDPLIVDAGVDPAWAAEMAASGAFANAGQVCVSVERIYVHREVAPAFTEALVERARALRMGDPRDPATSMGPMVDAVQRAVVQEHLSDAVARGARVLTGGAAPEGPGAFFPPTVVDGAHDAMALMREETFGPVAAIRVVDDFDAALAAAAEGDYGLAATVLTPSMANAQRAWRELPAGTVKVNAVWGGAPGGSAEPRRGSGLGLGYGPRLLDELTAMKVVHLAPPGPGA
jgi:succinate-semialdehyde dehydrogenase/glutarate-semialdehyde dehydrogenase